MKMYSSGWISFNPALPISNSLLPIQVKIEYLRMMAKRIAAIKNVPVSEKPVHSKQNSYRYLKINSHQNKTKGT